MRNYMTAFYYLKWRLRVPRKKKKFILGTKPTKKEKNRLIEEFFNNPDFGHPVCHQCGCYGTYMVDHGVEYPEIYQDDKCLRCHTIVSYRDNSSTRYTVLNLKESHESDVENYPERYSKKIKKKFRIN